MRVNLCAFLAGALLVSTPVAAGNITAANNQVSWQSTQCTAPTAPESIASADRHSRADDMNKRVNDYNQYVQQVQSYMDCISKEAQTDANSTSQAITGTAQKSIDDMRKNVAEMAGPLQAKK